MTELSAYNFKCKGCGKKKPFSRINSSSYCNKCKQKRNSSIYWKSIWGKK